MGVSPEKVTLVLVTGRLSTCAALLDTKVIEEPESSRARARNAFPPGPVSVTWLVIIRMSGILGDCGARALVATAG